MRRQRTPAVEAEGNVRVISLPHRAGATRELDLASGSMLATPRSDRVRTSALGLSPEPLARLLQASGDSVKWRPDSGQKGSEARRWTRLSARANPLLGDVLGLQPGRRVNRGRTAVIVHHVQREGAGPFVLIGAGPTGPRTITPLWPKWAPLALL